MDAQAFALTMSRVTDEAKAGNETGAMSSMLKYYGTELNKRRAELTMSVAGVDGLKFGRPGAGGPRADVVAHQGELDRGRHLGGPAQHHREERAAAAGRLRVFAMSLVLTEDQQMFRDAVKRFAAERAPGRAIAQAARCERRHRLQSRSVEGNGRDGLGRRAGP